MSVSEKFRFLSPTTALVEFFLPFVRFVVSFLPNGCHPNISGGISIHQQLFDFKKLAVCSRKSLIIGDNSRWFQQPCVSSCQPETPLTSKLVKKKFGSQSAEPGRRRHAGCRQTHRCACSLNTLVRVLLEKVCLLSSNMEKLKAACVFVRFQMLRI